MCFVSVDFVDDPNVAGYGFWYWSKFREAKVGNRVIAPLGRHNNLQEGVIIQVLFRTEYEAPFPFERIKRIKKLKKESQSVQNCK